MKVDVLLGLQWGDEGKGKVVDVLTPRYDVVARFQGGPNAGHTLEFEGKKYVLRSIPSGIFQHGQVNIIGNGVVLDPVLFREEAEDLEKSGVDIKKILKISKKAHLIMPTHRLLDAANEKLKGSSKIGTTGKGIGPTYTDKVSRNGLRVGDIFHNFEEKYAAAKARHVKMLEMLDALSDFSELEAKWLDAINYLKQYELIDSEHYINHLLADGKSVLCEGAQGSAPFPTELFDETGSKIRDLGHEYGAVTGRERRCGWIDLVALRYAIMLSGVTQLIMMKSDVLDTFPTIKACTAYKVNGTLTRDFPYSIEDGVEPVYEEIKGWNTDMTKIKNEDEFPAEFNAYVAFLEKELNVPITILSVGPDREQTIVSSNFKH